MWIGFLGGKRLQGGSTGRISTKIMEYMIFFVHFRRFSELLLQGCRIEHSRKTIFVADRSPKLFGWNCTLDRSEVEESSDVEMSLIFLDFHIHTYFMHITICFQIFTPTDEPGGSLGRHVISRNVSHVLLEQPSLATTKPQLLLMVQKSCTS